MSWSVDKSRVHLRAFADVKGKVLMRPVETSASRCCSRWFYTRDVNQLSSGAEPALTLLQRESGAAGKSEAFVYEATREESRTVANIFFHIFFSSPFAYEVAGRNGN